MDDGLGLGGLDDYLLGRDIAEEDQDDIDDEDDSILYHSVQSSEWLFQKSVLGRCVTTNGPRSRYGYAEDDYESDYDATRSEGTVAGSLLESLSTGLGDLSSGLAATVIGAEPDPPASPKKKTPKSTALPYHRLGGMPGTHPGASGPVPIGVPAVSGRALLIKTTTLVEALAAIDLSPESSSHSPSSGKSANWRLWGFELGFAGLCLALRQAGFAVALQPSAVGTLLSTAASGGGNEGVPLHSAAAAAGFRDAFDETVLLPGLRSNYMLHGKVGIL